MKIKRGFENDDMVRFISAKEFRESGMLWMVNSFLHLFGMAITVDTESNTLNAAIVKFRGFSQDCNDAGYRKVTQYMIDNAADLIADCEPNETETEVR